MQITEPVTMLTDYALGAVNLFFAISILTKLHSRNKVSGLLLLLAFLSQTIAGFVGGTYHGFAVSAAKRSNSGMKLKLENVDDGFPWNSR